MSNEIQQRLKWVTHYFESNDADLTCRRCGISRPTLRKWINRYKEKGIDGLKGLSKRPLNSPNVKVTPAIKLLIKDLRTERNLGARRIQSELIRNHSIKLSLASIHKTITRFNAKPLIKPKRSKRYKRYQRPIPGDRVQVDVIKIQNGIYQYTAVDDCTRYRVLGLFSRRTGCNTIKFFEQVIEEMPFPI